LGVIDSPVAEKINSDSNNQAVTIIITDCFHFSLVNASFKSFVLLVFSFLSL